MDAGPAPPSSRPTGPLTATAPLRDTIVLDLSQLVAGPYCSMILADLGADVIKIESPQGDLQRSAMRQLSEAADSAAFLALNRNKRSVVIDLTNAEGRQLFLDLVRGTDVLLENFRPGVTERLGIDYSRLSEVSPGLIYASITGFGEGGPYAKRPGLDLIAQAMTGIMSVSGHAGAAPVKAGVPLTDLAAGMYAAIGVMGALLARRSSGRGQRLSTSLFQAGLALGVNESAAFWSEGEVPRPLGSRHRFAAPYQAFKTRNGHITVGAGSQKLWEQLCEAIGRAGLASDPRFSSNGLRMSNQAALEEELEKVFRENDTDHWVDALLQAGVPAGPILDYGQVLADPHALAVGMVQSVEHPQAGTTKLLGSPITWTGYARRHPTPPPLLGEHTWEVLNEFGIAAERIEKLHSLGAVGSA